MAKLLRPSTLIKNFKELSYQKKLKIVLLKVILFVQLVQINKKKQSFKDKEMMDNIESERVDWRMKELE